MFRNINTIIQTVFSFVNIRVKFLNKALSLSIYIYIYI